MRLTLIQKEEINKISIVINKVVRSPDHGLIWEGFSNIYMYGETLADLLLNKTPKINKVELYIQVHDFDEVTAFLMKVKNFDLFEEVNNFSKIKVKDILVIKYIMQDDEIFLIFGKNKIKDFLKENEAINLYKIYLEEKNLKIIKDILNINKIIEKTWKSKEFKKDYDEKKIRISNVPWLTNVEQLEILSEDLKILKNKLSLYEF